METLVLFFTFCFASLSFAVEIPLLQGSLRAAIMDIPDPDSDFAVSPSGHIYLTFDGDQQLGRLNFAKGQFEKIILPHHRDFLIRSFIVASEEKIFLLIGPSLDEDDLGWVEYLIEINPNHPEQWQEWSLQMLDQRHRYDLSFAGVTCEKLYLGNLRRGPIFSIERSSLRSNNPLEITSIQLQEDAWSFSNPLISQNKPIGIAAQIEGHGFTSKNVTWVKFDLKAGSTSVPMAQILVPDAIMFRFDLCRPFLLDVESREKSAEKIIASYYRERDGHSLVYVVEMNSGNYRFLMEVPYQIGDILALHDESVFIAMKSNGELHEPVLLIPDTAALVPAHIKSLNAYKHWLLSQIEAGYTMLRQEIASRGGDNNIFSVREISKIIGTELEQIDDQWASKVRRAQKLLPFATVIWSAHKERYNNYKD